MLKSDSPPPSAAPPLLAAPPLAPADCDEVPFELASCVVVASAKKELALFGLLLLLPLLLVLDGSLTMGSYGQ